MKNEKKNKQNFSKPIKDKETKRHNSYAFREKANGKVKVHKDYAGPNDVQWYAKNTTLLHNAANISYANALGTAVDPNNRGNAFLDESFPGIITYSLVHGPGVADGGLSPANVCAENIYSYIRQANSGGKNYDPNDLMSYLLAVDEAYILFFEAARILGCINLYNNENRYAPRELVRALGWDYEDVISNLANLRYYVNSYGTKLNALPVPKVWPYYQRHAWMYAGVYADGTGAKAQLYAFKPIITRVRDDETGNLRTYKLDGSPLDKTAFVRGIDTVPTRTVANFVTVTNLVFEALINSQDVGNIAGDIKKAFGDEGLMRVSLVPDNYFIIPTYNEEVLTQFQNATVFEGLTDLDIIMDNSLSAGDVLYTPKAFIGTGIRGDNESYLSEWRDVIPGTGSQIINLNVTNPMPGDTIVATRLMACADGSFYKQDETVWTEIIPDDEASTMWNSEITRLALGITGAGSELVAGVTVYTLKPNGTRTNINILPVYNTIFNAQALAAATATMKLSKFKFHPGVYLGTAVTTSEELIKESNGLFMEIDTYSLVAPDVLKNMHSVALLSQFDVPILR